MAAVSISLPPSQSCITHKTSMNSPTMHIKFLPAFRPKTPNPINAATINPTTSTDPPTKNTPPPPKPRFSIWVNPKRLKQSYNSPPPSPRYASLTSISNSLNSCNPTENDVFSVLSLLMGENPPENDAVFVLNNIDNWKIALLALIYFLSKSKPKNQILLFNVTLKAYRKSREWDRAEELLNDMLEKGVKPDNVTFSTMISFARLCYLPQKAVEWFEKMGSFGCVPDGVTYSAMIDTYGRMGNVDKVMELHEEASKANWKLDLVAFATLIRVYGMSGDFDGVLRKYEEMKESGIKPNLVVYNTLLDSMGRAGKPWEVKHIYKEMIAAGVTPNWITYAARIRAFARARYAEDALTVYKQMKEGGFELSVVLYNTLLSMCADIGYVDEAIEMFNEMESLENCQPDSFTYSSMITIYSCSSDVSKAEEMLNRMLEAGFGPNIFVLTSLIQCYGKAKRTDDVKRAFDRVVEMGIVPDDRLCGCLLSVLIQTPREELGTLVDCIERANPKLGLVVKMLMDGDVTAGFVRQEAAELLKSISNAVPKAYCNCLIDLCVNLGMHEKARVLFELGVELEIYSKLHSKTHAQWSLHLRSLSSGAAVTALRAWTDELSKALEKDDVDDVPSLFGINTGHGKHHYTEKGLAAFFDSHLKEINAPFHENPNRVGWFMTTKKAVKSWLMSKSSSELVAA